MEKKFVSDGKPPLIDDPTNLFNLESSNMREKIDMALENSGEFSLKEIIEIYHQVINVTSIAKIIKENPGMDQSFLLSVQEIEKQVNEKFNGFLHPKIRTHLEKSNEELRKKLKNINKTNKTKIEIENQAKMFEQLRQIMSTQEFVNQYDKIVSK